MVDLTLVVFFFLPVIKGANIRDVDGALVMSVEEGKVRCPKKTRFLLLSRPVGLTFF